MKRYGFKERIKGASVLMLSAIWYLFDPLWIEQTLFGALNLRRLARKMRKKSEVA